jgi:hypothetical protein
MGKFGSVKPLLGTPLDRSHPLSKGLVGCWLMNEGSGTKVSDMSGNKAIGSISLAKWKPGRFGNCLNFNAGSIAVVNMGSNPVYDLTTNFTYVALINNVNWGNTSPIIMKGGWRTFLGFNTGKLSVCTNNTTFTNGNTVLNINQTYLATWTHTSSIDKLYLNDFLDTTSFDKADPTNLAGTNLIFGSSGSYRAGGDIEAVWIYNRALSSSEVQQLYIDPFQMFYKPGIELFSAAGSGPAPSNIIYDYTIAIGGAA